jgi:KaiC/GvpD/RAD55 family RecA-like ATPase
MMSLSVSAATKSAEKGSLGLPILSDLFGRIPYGRVLLAMFDPDSQYNSLMVNIAAEHLKSGGDLLYLVSSKPVPEIRKQFYDLAVNVDEYEAKDNAVLVDVYSSQMGGKSSEKYRSMTSNLNDVSISISESAPQWPAGTLVIGESFSNIAINQEDMFAKFSRKMVSVWRSQGTVMIVGLAVDLHPPEFYQEMKLLTDGVFEVRLTEQGGEMINTLRARSMKGRGSDTRRRQILFDDKMEASLRLLN